MGFTYQRSLKRHELRLLQPIILSHNFLSFRSLVVPRTGAPPYTAVSYTWGDEPPSQTIQLDGQSFSVRLNLWSCLHYISSHARNAGVEYLWADAICINQNDTDERSAQVSLMDQTYANASFVSVWLGLPTLPEHLWDQIPQHEPIRTLDSDGIDFHDSMADLANRPYWSRFWVIQEFLLGKDVMLYCNNTGMNWLDFKTILCMEVGIDETRSMDQLNDRVGAENAFKALPLVMGRHVDKHPEFLQPLYDLLVDHRNSKCKDPRDRIFALLGLVSTDERALLSRVFPDYKISKDHVLIITLAHLMQSSLLGQQHKTITPDSTEVFEGLGVESARERKRLIRRAKWLDYLDFETSSEIQGVLASDDEIEIIQEIGSEDVESEDSGAEPRTRNVVLIVVAPVMVLIVAALFLYWFFALDREYPLPIKPPWSQVALD